MSQKSEAEAEAVAERCNTDSLTFNDDHGGPRDVFDHLVRRIDRIDRSIFANTSLGGCRTVQNNLIVNLFNPAQIWIPSPNGVQQGPIPGYRLRANTNYANNPRPYYEEPFNNHGKVCIRMRPQRFFQKADITCCTVFSSRE